MPKITITFDKEERSYRRVVLAVKAMAEHNDKAHKVTDALLDAIYVQLCHLLGGFPKDVKEHPVAFQRYADQTDPEIAKRRKATAAKIKAHWAAKKGRQRGLYAQARRP